MQRSTSIAIVLSSFFAHAISLGRHATIVDRHEVSSHGDYDYVVVGGGVAGLTVADRLTEDPRISVLVVERGPLDKGEPEVLVPGLLNLTSTPYWYNLTSTPQVGLDGRKFQVPAADVVGGGSIINGMFFDRGSAADYDAWAQLGNPGWAWADMLPYFKKSENFTPAAADFAAEFDISWDDGVHGFGGPVQSSYPVFQYPGIKNFFEAWADLGITMPKDPGAGTAYGAFWAPSSLDPKDETRSSARTAHYNRAVKRPNFHVLTDTAVSRILFDGTCAIGAEIVIVSGSYCGASTVKASQEIILAAGVHSAQILQLSGMGDATLLQQHGIELVHELPGVGHNFQDHPTLYPVFHFQTAIHPNSDDLSNNATYAAEQLALYWSSRQGPYTIVHEGGNTVAFLPLLNLTTDANSIIARIEQSDQSCDVESPQICAGYSAQRRLIEKLYQSTHASVMEIGWNSGSVMPITLVKPLSRGSLSITSNNVSDVPVVDWRTFTHAADILVLAEGLRKVRDLMKTAPMQALSPMELVPGANVTTDADIEAALRQQAQPTYSHPCCAAPMMPLELGGVLDPQLRVYGVQRLRVVDASIFPMIPATHTSATVYAVAEKAADLIKASYYHDHSEGHT